MAEVEAEAARAELGPDPLIGCVLNGRFDIVRRIARGGMADVYFATQAPLGRPVAVKVLHGIRSIDAESEENFRARFLREASILAKLQHPNIVVLLDYGLIADLPGDQFFMAMEYLRGQTLAQRFRTRSLSIEESIRLARQIGRGLREAHRSGFIHRDLKPSNIILVPEDAQNDIVKLVDFGIGKILPELGDQRLAGEDVTRAGLLLGSPRYMSPEQIRSEPVELRTDIYSLGVILFQALTGRLPFEAKTEFDVLLAHCMTPAPALSDVRPGNYFPPSLSLLVNALLQKQPASRPTVEEFLQRLAVVEEEVFGSVGVAGPTFQSLSPSARSRPPSTPRTLVEGNIDSLRSPVFSETLAAPSAPRRRRRFLAGAVALIGLLGMSLALAHSLGVTARITHSEASSVSGPSPSANVAPVLAIAAATASVPASVLAFELTLNSAPEKATVTESGRILGVTPVKLDVERQSVARGPRRFVVKHEGYAPYVLDQGDSERAVNVLARLEPSRRAEPASSRTPRRAKEPKNVALPSSSADASAKRGGAGLDIRLRR